MRTYYVHEVQDTCGVSYIVSPLINPVYGTEFKWDSFVVETIDANSIRAALARARKYYNDVTATDKDGLL